MAVSILTSGKVFLKFVYGQDRTPTAHSPDLVLPPAGNYGKLGHGDNATQKSPKLIAAFAGKVSAYCLLLQDVLNSWFSSLRLCVVWRVVTDIRLLSPWMENCTRGGKGIMGGWVSVREGKEEGGGEGSEGEEGVGRWVKEEVG